MALTPMCPQCKKEKDVSMFFVDNNTKSGRACWCKECKVKRNKKYYKKEYMRKYRERHPEKKGEYYLKNRDSLLKKQSEYQQNNRKKCSEKMKAWRKNNPEKLAKTILKMRSSIKYRLNERITSGIYKSLHGNKGNRKWEDLAGYTAEDLIKRLKKSLPVGYTWNDYVMGAKLHIDHIIPISVFNFNTPEDDDFKRCWALDNLRLLPATENLKKSKKLYKHFQPSLRFQRETECQV